MEETPKTNVEPAKSPNNILKSGAVSIDVSQQQPFFAMIAKSAELKQQAEALVIDTRTEADAKALLKEIRNFTKSVEEDRKTITRQLDGAKKLLMNRETEMTRGAEEAKKIVSDKMLAYEEELRHKAEVEAERLKGLALGLIGTDITREAIARAQTEAELTAMNEKMMERYNAVPLEDQLAPIIVSTKAQIEITIADRRAEIRRAAIKSSQDETELKRIDIEQRAEILEKQDEVKQAIAEDKKNQTEAPKFGARTRLEIVIDDPAAVPRELCEPSLALIRQYVKDTGNKEIAGVIIREVRSI